MKNYSELHVESEPGFNFMDQENGDGVHAEIWNQFDLNESSILYGDFPSLPDFPCMSSSSSSSATPAPVKPLSKSSSSSSSSSSSAASWAVLKSDMQQGHGGGRGGEYESVDVSTAALSSTASLENPNEDCLDVMEDFGFMDLLEGTDLLDSSSIFQSDDMSLIDEYQVVQQEKPQCEQLMFQQQQEVEQGGAMNISIQGANISDSLQQGESTEELAVMFFEWLKSNKDRISAEDLRRVKIKKSTIESAVRRLGGGKEAMKKLLRLVLDWVQFNHLERRQHRDASAYSIDHATHQNPNSNPLPNSNPSYPVSLDPYTQPQYWMPPPQPYVPTDQVAGLVGGGYMCTHPNSLGVVNGYTYMPQPENYNMVEATGSWPPHYSPFVDGNFNPGSVQGQVFTGYGNNSPYQYLPGQSDELVRMGSSATKEARKKRMARQRRNSSFHRNHGTQNQIAEQQVRLGNDACVPTNQGSGGGNWVYWPSGVGGSSRPSAGAIHAMDVPPLLQTIDQPIVQPQQRQLASDRRQGWKPEKNLRFLLQKVLKQSDVGNLGRIVLPKKEAEMHLPELDARDGISIAMEDIGTSRVWNMRYRFWPNNKSRMYLLENTGDFVRANGLQEGDFIVIYSDVKSGKYLIRGVKVRQPGLRPEHKKPSKSHRTMHANSPAATASAHGHGANDNVLSTPSTRKLSKQ